jgi:tetratricopeptide (TPR) repeat protein
LNHCGGNWKRLALARVDRQLTPGFDELIGYARRAMGANDWATVARVAADVQFRFPGQADGPYLAALAEKMLGRPESAAQYYERALQLDQSRYDVAIELAKHCLSINRYPRARDLLRQYVGRAGGSPVYLDMAGEVYMAMGHYELAWPLYEKALEIQPDIEIVQMHKAACAVYLGKIEKARHIYREILDQSPGHQRAHFELAQLARARDRSHIDEMVQALGDDSTDPSKNVFLYYALGKEHEDLEDWGAAFDYFERAGDAVKQVSRYDVREDVELIDAITSTCSREWLEEDMSAEPSDRTPIFVVGLPRTGTTLTDRILSAHSLIESAGESQLMQMVLRGGTRANNHIGITIGQIRKAAKRDPADIAESYMSAISHRLDESPYFVEKLPENVLYLGFIARSWPNAKIVHLRRHPMDACFALFKQSYFRFAYSLDDLAEYYLAYDKLSRHWREVLESRMIEVAYEDIVSDQEGQTRRLLNYLGLDFEESCLNFETNRSPVATASSVQVREKIHARSVGKWANVEEQLMPLYERLRAGGVEF